MASDIKLAVETLADRHDLYVTAENYYRGDEREVFASAKWGQYQKNYGLDYVLNFSKTVVDTVLDRLDITSVQGTSAEADAAINKIWEQNELVLDANEIHRQALVFGECYAIVWPDDDGEVQITYNSPLTTIMLYDDENPRIKKAAAKMWQTSNEADQKIVRLNIYYPDRVVKYSRQGELQLMSGDQNSWTLIDTVENPWGEVPVFHFRTHRPYGTPEHASAIGPQDSINKLVMNHMETVDYQGAPQRYALSNFGNETEGADAFDDNDTARENINSLRSHPGDVWFMNGVSMVGQFQPADHKQFTEPILAYVKFMASLTQTPLHHFQNNGQFASGEALRTAEAPLVKKINDRQLSFGSTWRELFRFALKINDIISDVQVKWAGVESIDATDAWNIATIKLGAGMTLKRVLTEMGYDEEVADEIVKEAEEDAKRKQELGITAGGAAGTAELGAGMNQHNIAVQQAAAQRKAEAGTEEVAQ